MFRRISYTIALQFTAFVFLLLLVNGAIFLAADFQNARRQTHARLEQTLISILRQADRSPEEFPLNIPPPLRERIRITDTAGTTIYSGSIFAEIPFSPTLGYTRARIDGEEYRILTGNISRGGVPVGFAQILDLERLQFGDLPTRALIYLLVSAGISALTFSVGLYFARRSLKPAERMVERLEQFTQDASHELRTPIATVNSSLDLALKTENFRDGILSAKDDLKQLSAIIERLLELARLDQLMIQAEPIDLSSLVTDAVDKYKILATEKQVTIESDIKEGVSVRGDGPLLRQVIANLLTNAIKFSKPEGGTIHVTLTDKVLSVTDTGIGIAPDTMPHIFDRFFQADHSRSHGGVGLGLALVKRIVELHGWKIAAKSKVAKGTKFVIECTKA
jgi:signal transduction histidine kinase